jgi:dolichyl-phosphate-mannose--protein O-mannosyl transferase
MKLSALLIFLKVFGIKTRFRYTTYFLVAVQAFFYLASTGITVGLLFLCIAENGTTHTFCTQTYKLIIVQRVFGVITDFLVLGMPIPVIWGLSYEVSKKIKITALFMTGFM